MNRTLQVGIIGASAERGWARISHVPAVQHLHGLELGAVVSSNQSSADAAAKAFGAPIAYGNAADLIQNPSIDIVTVAVKVPDHRELVLRAVEAGKHVYCEWPLGRNIEEAAELAAAADAAGVHCAIGLQTRLNPVLQHARSLLSAGAIGRVLSANIISTTVAFGHEVEKAMAFAEDEANGTTLVTIQAGHTLDFAIAVLGSLEEQSSYASTQFPEVHVEGSALQERTTHDHLLTDGCVRPAIALGIEVAGGRPMGHTPFQFQITGERGQLLLEGGAARGFQSGIFRLLLDGKQQKVDAGELKGLSETAFNVAGVYAALRDDILSGSRTVPDLQHAVRLTRLMNDILASSKEGTRRQANDWPAQQTL